MIFCLEVKVINELRDVVRRHVLHVVPGLLGHIGLLTTKRYGVVNLLFTSLTKLYILLIEYYRTLILVCVHSVRL
ncbi:MAG: hypothetical protein QXP80_04125 [Zestosphaera sp.]